jgi:ribosomal protein S17E
MGRIKIALVKRTTKELMKNFQFADDFERDKKMLNGTIESKRIRNMIAGYIKRIQRRNDRKPKII